MDKNQIIAEIAELKASGAIPQEWEAVTLNVMGMVFKSLEAKAPEAVVPPDSDPDDQF